MRNPRISHGISPQISQISHEIFHGISHGISYRISQGISKGISHGILDFPWDVPLDFPWEIRWDIPGFVVMGYAIGYTMGYPMGYHMGNPMGYPCSFHHVPPNVFNTFVFIVPYLCLYSGRPIQRDLQPCRRCYGGTRKQMRDGKAHNPPIPREPVSPGINYNYRNIINICMKFTGPLDQGV